MQIIYLPSHFIFFLKDSDGNVEKEELKLLQRIANNKNIELKVILPQKKQRYTLELFGQFKLDNTSIFKFIGILHLQRELGDLKVNTMFLKTFGNYSDINAYVFSPCYFNLICGKSYTFRLYVPNASKVALVYNDEEWILLSTESNNIWSIERVFDKPGKLECFNENANANKWNGICEYKVV